MAPAACCSFGRPLLDRALCLINRTTADVCDDHPRSKVIDEPSPRPILRLVVSTLAALAAIIAITFVYTSSVGSRTERHWGSHYLLTLPTYQENYPNLLCPCNKSSIPWPYFVRFYWINQTENHTSSWNRYPIANYTQFCDPLVANNGTTGIWRQACYSMGQSLTAYTNQTMRTTMSTNTVTSPSVLAHMITIDMQNNVNDVFTDYSYLTANHFADWVQLLTIKQMFDRAAYRFVISTGFMGDENGTNDLYWRFSSGDFYKRPPTWSNIKAFDLTGNRALVLQMDWTVYVHQCNPLYCDQVVKNSLLRRFGTAVIAVGGFAAVMMLLLRGLVWPCIRSLNRWPD